MRNLVRITVNSNRLKPSCPDFIGFDGISSTEWLFSYTSENGGHKGHGLPEALQAPFPHKSRSLREKQMHPQGCQILSLDPLLFGLNHMPGNWRIRQDSHPQTLRSKRSMI